jgi:hypothetical protein
MSVIARSRDIGGEAIKKARAELEPLRKKQRFGICMGGERNWSSLCETHTSLRSAPINKTFIEKSKEGPNLCCI